MLLFYGAKSNTKLDQILIFNSENPLGKWNKNVINGHIKRICDPDIQSNVLEVMGTDVNTCFINSP